MTSINCFSRKSRSDIHVAPSAHAKYNARGRALVPWKNRDRILNSRFPSTRFVVFSTSSVGGNWELSILSRFSMIEHSYGGGGESPFIGEFGNPFVGGAVAVRTL